MNQEEIARRLGIPDRSTISRWTAKLLPGHERGAAYSEEEYEVLAQHARVARHLNVQETQEGVQVAQIHKDTARPAHIILWASQSDLKALSSVVEEQDGKLGHLEQQIIILRANVLKVLVRLGIEDANSPAVEHAIERARRLIEAMESKR